MILEHPEVAYRDCDHCQKFQYDKETGEVILGRNGLPDERFEACPPPCRTPEGCPKGTPENQLALLPEMQECYQHYRECRAVGIFPDDPLVKRNAAAIREVFDRHEANKQVLFQQMLMLAVRSKGG